MLSPHSLIEHANASDPGLNDRLTAMIKRSIAKLDPQSAFSLDDPKRMNKDDILVETDLSTVTSPTFKA